MSTPTDPDSPPPSAVSTTPSDAADRSTRSIRVLSILVIIAGAIFIVAGAVTWFVVHDQLADEKIVVSDDAERFGGWEVDGPFTAYAEADAIEKHALESSGGKTYAELDHEDPTRETVMTASFLQVLAVHLRCRLRRCLHGGRPRPGAHRNRRGAAARCPPPQYRSLRRCSDLRRYQPLTPPNDVPSRRPRRDGGWYAAVDLPGTPDLKRGGAVVSRRQMLQGAAVGAGLAAANTLTSRLPRAWSAPPYSVVLVLVDDMRFDYHGLLNVFATGPWIDCTWAASQTPMCAPSRASMLTGSYSWRTPVVSNPTASNTPQIEANTVATRMPRSGIPHGARR